MAADELLKPLGLEPVRKWRRTAIVAIAAPPVAIAIGLAAFWFGGFGPGAPRPGPVVAAKSTDQTGSVASTVEPLAAPQGDTPGLVEISPDGSVEEPGGDVVITDPSLPQPVRLAAAPREDLVEKGRYGPLPKIGADGTRPLDAYAGSAQVESGMKRIAIVVGGIGVEGEASAAAIKALPSSVTLGFAPYGDDLSPALAEARALGHEVLLQIPLEPYNYPDVDPGPRTLTLNASPDTNLDRLRWLMSRMTTYVGVMNYMGARFTGEDDALKPILDEVAARGLLYLDDGSSGRSRAVEIAGSGPVLRADVVLDADTTPAAIDARLDQLAAIAKQRGFAIATGTAFPTTIDRVAAFAAAAEKRGFAIVPLSSLATPGRS